MALSGVACSGSRGAPLAPATLGEPNTAVARTASAISPGARAFADGELLVVRLTLSPSDVRELDEHGNRERYVPASVRVEGRAHGPEELPEVGVRHKGSYTLHHCWDDFGGIRSRDGDCAKLSLKLKFDAYRDGARFDGLKRLNLHASSPDPSKLRELIAYRAFREYGVDAPRAVPAQVFVNGEPRGLFIAVEEIDSRYAHAHFPGAGDGNLYKDVWPNPQFSERELREALQTGRARGDVADMRQFARAVAETDAQAFARDVEPFVELESLLRYLVVDRALRNWDGATAFYRPRSGHNFFWYRDDGQAPPFHLIPWDLDATLWAFHPYAEPREWVTAPPVPDLNTRPSHCAPRPVWRADGPDRVTPPRCDKLINLLAETEWPRLAELGRDAVNGPLASAHLLATSDALAALMEPIVATDPTLELEAWRRAVRDLRAILTDVGPRLLALLEMGQRHESAAGEPPRSSLARHGP